MLRLADALGIPRVRRVGLPGRGASRRSTSGEPLCGDPRRADVSLQAMDARRLARARRGTCASAALPSSRSADPTRRSATISTRCGKAPPTSISCPGRRMSRCCRGRASMSGPDTSITHLAAATGCPTVALFGPMDPARLGTLAGRRPRRALAGQRHDPESRQRLDRAEPAALPALHLRGLRAAHRKRQRLPGGTHAPNRCWPRPIRRLPQRAAPLRLDRRPLPASMSGVMSPRPNLGPKPHLGYTESLIDRAAERRLDTAWLGACLRRRAHQEPMSSAAR